MKTKENLEGQINFWKKVLGLTNYQITPEKVSPLRVYDVKLGRCNNRFMGIMVDGENKATLFFTYHPKQDDIVHELLHLAYPDWPHEDIVSETENILRKGC